MTGPAHEAIRFVFDEDSRGFGLWISRLRHDMTCVGSEPVTELLPLGTLDPEWIPTVAQRGWVAITKNSHIRTQPEESKLAIEHGLVVACLIEPRRHANRWDFAQSLFRHWDAVEDLASKPGPAWLALNKDRPRSYEFQPGKAPRARPRQL